MPETPPSGWYRTEEEASRHGEAVHLQLLDPQAWDLDVFHDDDEMWSWTLICGDWCLDYNDEFEVVLSWIGDSEVEAEYQVATPVLGSHPSDPNAAVHEALTRLASPLVLTVMKGQQPPAPKTSLFELLQKR